MLSNDQEAKLTRHGKSISLLLVDDDPIALEIYQDSLSPFFGSIATAIDGSHALRKIIDAPNGYDLIVTDIMMPKMDGFELIRAVRKSSFKQRFIILTALDDLNQMHEIINLGVDGILKKPYDKSLFLNVIYRVFVNIMHEKLLKAKVKQVELFTKETLELKFSLKEHESPVPREPKIQKEIFPAKPKLGKYDTRQTLVGSSSEELLSDIDYVNLDKMDIFQDKLMSYEVILCKISSLSSPRAIKESFTHVAKGLGEFVDALNMVGHFTLATSSALYFIEFLQNIDETALAEEEKRELAIDGLMHLLQDINEWIVTVFVRKEAQNINYFDASFANNCLQIEMIFQEEKELEEEDSLEFF